LKHFLLTVDVEDWFQVENLRPWFPMDTWSSQQLRIEKSTKTILELLGSKTSQDGKPLQATFFILGWIARKIPSLVREIKAAGHEVASHGYNHRLCVDQTKDGLQKDLEQSKKLLEDILGCEVHGYRAPSFSISKTILEMIRQAGYTYDASYNSFCLNNRYGRLDINEHDKKGIAVDLGQGFYELPLSNLQFGNWCLPFSGGGYFRLLPGPVFKMAVRRILHDQGAYHFYLHPWEVDPDQPRQNQVPLPTRFRHYINLQKTLPKLQTLLESFADCRFSTCTEYLGYIRKDQIETTAL